MKYMSILKYSTLIYVLQLVFGITQNANAISITTTFDTDLEGWSSTGGILSFNGSGGNPGGFLSLQDNVGIGLR